MNRQQQLEQEYELLIKEIEEDGMCLTRMSRLFYIEDELDEIERQESNSEFFRPYQP